MPHPTPTRERKDVAADVQKSPKDALAPPVLCRRRTKVSKKCAKRQDARDDRIRARRAPAEQARTRDQLACRKRTQAPKPECEA